MKLRIVLYTTLFFSLLIFFFTFLANSANAQVTLDFDTTSNELPTKTTQDLSTTISFTNQYWTNFQSSAGHTVEWEDITQLAFLFNENSAPTTLNLTCNTDSQYNYTANLTETNETHTVTGTVFEWYTLPIQDMVSCFSWTTDTVNFSTFKPTTGGFYNAFWYNFFASQRYHVRLYTGSEPLAEPEPEPIFLPFAYDTQISSTTCTYGNGSSTCTYSYSTTSDSTANPISFDGFLLMFGIFLLFQGVSTWYTVINKLS